MSDGPQAPPGWYDDNGTQRYWDGQAWTDYTAANYWNLRNQSTPANEPTPTHNQPVRSAGARRAPGKPWHRMWQFWAGIALASCSGLGLIGSLADPHKAETIQITSQEHSAAAETTDSPTPAAKTPTPTPAPSPTATPRPDPGPTTKKVALLFIRDQKDGDSWVASNGTEYRLGLVNAPEVNEKCSSEASAFTRQFLASGFTVDDYSTDTYGRHVAEVFDQSGKSLNVALAKSGLGNGKYLGQFRHENPDLAARLDQAFASPATPSCIKTVAPVPFVQKSTPQPTYEPPDSSDSSDGDSPSSGAHAVCRDGTFSYSQNRSGTCSHHGGVAKWLW